MPVSYLSGKIALAYARSWLLVDLASSVPWDRIIVALSGQACDCPTPLIWPGKFRLGHNFPIYQRVDQSKNYARVRCICATGVFSARAAAAD